MLAGGLTNGYDEANSGFSYIFNSHQSVSAYALHVLNHQHKYGPIQCTAELITPVNKDM
jgi:hypothetical protein